MFTPQLPERHDVFERLGARALSLLGSLPSWKKQLLAAGLVALVVCAVALGIILHFYRQYARIIDARLNEGVFGKPAVILAAPTEIVLGEASTADLVAAHLRRAGYKDGHDDDGIGGFALAPQALEIYPGVQSYFRNGEVQEGAARLEFKSGRLLSIRDLDKFMPLKAYWLEPEPITTMFGDNRAKRRLVTYQDLPKAVVDSVLATEDHRFYSHHGIDCLRIIAAAITDLRSHRRLEGASTLTMQLARNLFLSPRRTLRRKIKEAVIAMIMEHRLSKDQILVLYANQVYFGQRNSFSIYGFGEAASVYFNKNVHALTLPEAAYLTGLIRGPNFYSPYEHPERSAVRRNFVLERMREAGYITAAEAKRASAAPLGLNEQPVEGRQLAYFVDMVKAQLLVRFSEADLLSKGYRVYTTLDSELQQAASDGTQAGLAELDRQVKFTHAHTKAPSSSSRPPQIALVALDPATGDVKALVGGRAYDQSQLNHALAHRQPGSAFKPFVYAAALNSGLDGSDPLVTPATVLPDEPTTFEYADRSYSPRDYEEYHGQVTVREALAHSLNVPSVYLAEMAGYGKVRDLAVAAGFDSRLKPTPAIALGAYEATPLEVAGAYTIFANHGDYAAPRCIAAVTDAEGAMVWSNPVSTRPVLDPRVSYLMVSLLESVVNNGTGAGARARGFRLPAAGKTGTSRDGWFAGFTSNLLAVVWVGYDDDHDLQLTGAHSALPLWAEFMKRTTGFVQYRNPAPFAIPTGIDTAPIDNASNLVAASADPNSTHTEIFIAGTEPMPSSQVEPVSLSLDPAPAPTTPASEPATQQPGSQVRDRLLEELGFFSNRHNQ